MRELGVVEKECDYPLCEHPGVDGRQLDLDGPVVLLCTRHGLIVHRNDPSEDPDFWRWFHVMVDPRTG